MQLDTPVTLVGDSVHSGEIGGQGIPALPVHAMGSQKLDFVLLKVTVPVTFSGVEEVSVTVTVQVEVVRVGALTVPGEQETTVVVGCPVTVTVVDPLLAPCPVLPPVSPEYVAVTVAPPALLG